MEIEIYEQIVEAVLNMVDALKTNQASLKDVSMDEIVQTIRLVCHEKGNDGSISVDLYERLLLGEGRKKEDVMVVLLLLAQHLMLLASKDSLEASHEAYKTDFWNEHVKLEYYINRDKVRLWHEKYDKAEQSVNIPFQGRGVIYSAVTGGYDDVNEPEYVDDRFDYILFTDNPKITSKVWKVVLLENVYSLDNVRLARRVKIMGHEYLPEYDYSIWIDGKFKITGDFNKYVEKYRGGEPLLCFNHFRRNCAYKELETCLAMGKDDPVVMKEQMQRYRREGYPEKYGLIDSGILVRELHNEKIKRVMETWWSEVLNYSKRDQLSFGYACWKNDFVYDTNDMFIYENDLVSAFEHKDFV